MSGARTRPLAVVTGASSRLGRELAEQFARNGFDLVVADEDHALRDVASELERLGAHVEPVWADAATDERFDELYERIAATGRPVEELVLDVGAAALDPATDRDEQSDIRWHHLGAIMYLAKHVTLDMAQRGAGRVLIVSSVAAPTWGHDQTAYDEARSFVTFIAPQLRAELEGTGVTITSLVPAPATLLARAGVFGSRPGIDPAALARDGFAAMMAGAERAGWASPKTELQARAGRLITGWLEARRRAPDSRRR